MRAAVVALTVLCLGSLSAEPAPKGKAAQSPDGPLTYLGAVHRPLKPFPVTLWTNTSSGFIYPELTDGPFGIAALQSKLSLGVAHMCGGTRAGALTLGTLRALYAVRCGAADDAMSNSARL